MTYDRPPVFVPATSEYVLEVFRDYYRQQCETVLWETERGVDLTIETTVCEWRSASDLRDWRGLGRALGYQWKLDRPDSAWREVLEPADERTLRDVCEFIASGAVRPMIEPLSIAGTACRPAGAFLAIRYLLREAGVDADSVAPSTPLREYTRRHPDVFLGAISGLAPNALPAVRFIVSGWACMARLGVMLGFMAAAIGGVVSPLVMAGGVVLAVASWKTGRVVARSTPLFGVEFHSLRTFRDLAVAVAEGRKQAEESNQPWVNQADRRGFLGRLEWRADAVAAKNDADIRFVNVPASCPLERLRHRSIVSATRAPG